MAQGRPPKSGCSEIEEVDDSDSNKANLSRTRSIPPSDELIGQDSTPPPDPRLRREPGRFNPALEIIPEDEVMPDGVPECLLRKMNMLGKLDSGPSKTQENEPEVDSALSQRASEVKYMTYKVNKFGLEVAILGTKIDALRSGPRSLSRSLWHKITHLGFRISRLARPIRFQSRIRSTIRRYRYREQAGSSSPSVERVHEDEDETPEQQQQDQAPKSGISENEEGPESHKSESETAFQSYSRKGKAPIIDPPSSTSLHNQDEIEADQLVLSQEVDRILAKVKDLKCQALDLRSKSSSKAKPKSPICSEPPPTRPNMVAEWQKRGLTNTTEPLSLFQRNWELADKISFLELQVENLRSLVTDLESQSRIRFGSRISRYFKQRGRSSPKSS